MRDIENKKTKLINNSNFHVVIEKSRFFYLCCSHEF